MNKMITGGIVAGLLIILAIVYFSMKMSSQNENVRLKNRITAQKRSNEANFDKMFKVIAQIAQVADQYKDAFKDVYPKLMEGRYGNDKNGAHILWR